MTARMTVSERDLRTLAAMVTERRTDVPAEGLPTSLLSDLMSQIPCDLASFEGFDSEHATYWFIQDMPAREDAHSSNASCATPDAVTPHDSAWPAVGT